MFKYQQCRSNNFNHSQDKLEMNWLKFKSENFSLASSDFFDEFVDFYNTENYKNYKQFVNNLQQMIKYFNSHFNIFDNLSMLLLYELIMKNLSKSFFINIVSLNYDGLSYYENKSFDGYYSNLLQEYNLGLSTHLEFQKNIGEFKLLLHWPWCFNKVLDSNFEKKLSEETFIKINLKEVLRYSQNFVNYKQELKDEYYQNFDNLYETFIPLLPFNYKLKTLEIEETVEIEKNNFYFLDSKDEHSEIHKIKCRLSENFSMLKDKINFSQDFLQYCIDFHHLLFNAPKNIYENDFYITLPFWEIPRLQSLFSEEKLILDERNYWDEQRQLYEVHDDYDDQEDVFDELENDKREEDHQLYKEHLRDLIDWNPNWREDIDFPMDDGFY